MITRNVLCIFFIQVLQPESAKAQIPGNHHVIQTPWNYPCIFMFTVKLQDTKTPHSHDSKLISKSMSKRKRSGTHEVVSTYVKHNNALIPQKLPSKDCLTAGIMTTKITIITMARVSAHVS